MIASGGAQTSSQCGIGGKPYQSSSQRLVVTDGDEDAREIVLDDLDRASCSGGDDGDPGSRSLQD